MSGTTIIDRRAEPMDDTFGTDIERFKRRYRDIVRKAVNKDAVNRKMRELGQEGIYVPLPKESIHEPVIHHKGGSGNIKRVFTGNSAYDTGDMIPKPPGGGGGGGKGDPSDEGEGEDDFLWVSPEEYLSILFEGRQLPDMTKLKTTSVKIKEQERAGHTRRGPSQKLDASVTDRKRRGDELVLSKVAERRVVQNLSEQFNILARYDDGLPSIDMARKNTAQKAELVSQALEAVQEKYHVKIAVTPDKKGDALRSMLLGMLDVLKENLYEHVTKDEDISRLDVLEKRLPEQIKVKEKAGNFRESHLTYHYDDEVEQPSAKAVMFCKMDVSGSMGELEKNAAKGFFWLLYNFLKAKYDQTDVIFIRHTTYAEEVDEEAFFYDKKNGGTVVSTCVKKTREIIAERYPPAEWNIYCAQASDGDNISSDNEVLTQELEKLLPDVQAYYYTEIGENSWGPGLIPVFEKLEKQFPHLHTARMETAGDAADVFKKFFPQGENASALKLNI